MAAKKSDSNLPSAGQGSYAIRGMNIRYQRLENGDPMPVLEGSSPYKAVVIVEDAVGLEWQRAASRWLADSGCLYMMAWGDGCSSWDDSVDLANVLQFEGEEIPDDRLIMTTWHEDESLGDLFRFAKTADHSDVTIENLLILHIGAADRQSELESLYRDA